MSKVARFADIDREDIAGLAAERLFTPEAFEERALHALAYYVGGPAIKANVRHALALIRRAQQAPS